MPLPFTFRQLEILDAVITFGSITQAARELHTAQSSVSFAVDELERQVGQRLLIRRKGRGVHPTGAGRQFHREVQAVLRTAHEAERVLQEQDGQLRGPLAIGVYQTLAPYLLPLILKDFASSHPLVELSFVETSQTGLMSALSSGGIDVGFSYAHEVSAEVDCRVIIEQSPHVLLPADHRLAGRGGLYLADLADEPLILLGDAPSMAITLRVLDIAADDPRIAWRTSSRSLARALVGAGLGLAMVVQPNASPHSVDGHPLAELPLLDSPHKVQVQAAWLKPAARQRPPRRISELIEFMHDQLPQHIDMIEDRRRRNAKQP